MKALADKIGLSLVIWTRFLLVVRAKRRYELGALATELGTRPSRPLGRRHPVNLGRAVWKTLSPLQPRCITLALVHYRLLVEQGLEPRLVIGLPEASESFDAHAWVEVEGIDVGPPPGRGSRAPLAAYGPSGPVSP